MSAGDCENLEDLAQHDYSYSKTFLLAVQKEGSRAPLEAVPDHTGNKLCACRDRNFFYAVGGRHRIHLGRSVHFFLAGLANFDAALEEGAVFN
jgi:hypothetical protein